MTLKMARIILLTVCLIEAILLAQCFSIREVRSAEDDYTPYDIRYVQLEVDGKEYKLNLKNRQHNVFYDANPVWTVEYSEEKKDYVYKKVEISPQAVYYGDEEHMATLFAEQDEITRDYFFNGVIGAGTEIHIVKDALETWWKYPEDIEETANKLRSAYVRGDKEKELLEKSIPVIHPKILAVVDYNLYQKLDKNIDNVAKYVATFWNAVDLRYGKIESPKVELIVSGIIIVTDEKVKLLEKAQNYFNTEFIKATEFVNYDSAFVMTSSNTKSLKSETKLGSICNRKYSTVFVQDDANYGGLLQATHELGHLLNLPHDGHDEADSCKVETGEISTLMAPSVDSAKEMTWSKCSIDILKEFVKTKDAECLDDFYRYE